MGSKVKKNLKKFYHLCKTDGVIRAGRIMTAKSLYRMTKKKQIREWKKNRPEIVPGRLVFYSSVDYSDNARALSDYLVEQGYLKDHEIIWLVSDPEKFRQYEQPNLKFIREKYPYAGFRTPETFYYVYTAEKVFFTHSMRWVKDEDRLGGQKFIDLWHGCGYKSAKGKSENIHFDAVLVPGDVFVDTKTDFFQCDREKVLPLGYPRYDVMLAKREHGRDYIASCCGGHSDCKVIFWMPTYRMSDNQALSEQTLSGELNIPVIETMQDLEELNEVCSRNNVVMILKRHHLQSKYSMKQEFSNVKYMDDEDLEQAGVQLYETLSWVDALITDYSSVAIDYLLMDRPIGFTLDDFERYKESRGFVFEDPLSYMPGRHIYSKEEFFDFVGQISRGEDHWKEDRRSVIQKTHNLPEESYCRRIADHFHI